MVTRRRFLQGSLATAGLAAATGTLAGGPVLGTVIGAAGPHLELAGAWFESGHMASAGFGAAARRLGLTTFDIGHDITPAWLHVVQQWRSAPVAIAGMTTWTPLLLLQQSARDHGLRVTFRSEHRPAGGGTVNHVLEGPAEILQAFGDGIASGPDYGTCMAYALVRCPGAGGRGQAARAQLASAVQGPADPVPLYSWVIAPRGHAFAQGVIA